MKVGECLTKSWPGPSTTRPDGIDDSNLKPDAAGPFPVVDVGSIGHASHVERYGPKVRNSRVCDKAKRLASSYSGGRSAAAHGSSAYRRC
jgi:hypothetical protein